MMSVAKIIVVDDALTDRTLVSGILNQSIDCEVRLADSGGSALEIINEHRPDLVLTDIQMPGMNGLELLEAIKDEYPMVPVVLCDASRSDQLCAQAEVGSGSGSYDQSSARCDSGDHDSATTDASPGIRQPEIHALQRPGSGGVSGGAAAADAALSPAGR